MTHSVVMKHTGGPEVLEWLETPVGEPGPGQVRVKQSAVGLNFGDTMLRSGSAPYPFPLPGVLGLDAAGMVEAVGEGVTDFAVGDRVAYTMLLGSYAEARVLPAERMVKLPDDIDNRTAAAFIGKGLTARYLLRDVYPVKSGDVVLVHAAAGGVGSMLAQWANALGATVIGTVYHEEKIAFAKECGCHHVIQLGKEDLAARVAEITNGTKANVVYDSVGKDTFLPSLDCLRPRGWMVLYGITSGMVEPVSPMVFGMKGALCFTQPHLMPFIATRQALLNATDDLFDAIRTGKIHAQIQHAFPLREAARAHAEFDSRKLKGATVLEIDG
ncbi:MAG: quinone oxidoreductase [Pseudoxanthomonas sp.]